MELSDQHLKIKTARRARRLCFELGVPKVVLFSPASCGYSFFILLGEKNGKCDVNVSVLCVRVQESSFVAFYLGRKILM